MLFFELLIVIQLGHTHACDDNDAHVKSISLCSREEDLGGPWLEWNFAEQHAQFSYGRFVNSTVQLVFEVADGSCFCVNGLQEC